MTQRPTAGSAAGPALRGGGVRTRTTTRLVALACVLLAVLPVCQAQTK